MPDEISPSFVDRIRAAPKAELHVHLVGAMPPTFFIGQLEKYSREEAFSDAPPRHLEFFGRFDHLAAFLPGPAGKPRNGDLLGFTSFEGFLASYLLSTYYLRNLDDFRRLAARVRERLRADNIVYAELIISPAEHLPHAKIELEGLCELMDEVAAAGEPHIVWIVDLVRNTGAQAASDLLERLLEIRPSSWVGITLGGAEHLFPPAPFEKIYRRARDAGLRLSVHAGEALGPESVWDAVRLLGAERIGHGVRSIEDPRLVEYLAEQQIPLEVCPSSNIKTGIYESLRRHPLKQLHRAGIPLTVNTDDPAFFGVSLTDELVAARRAGLSEATVDEIRRNAFEQAFSFEGQVPD